VVAGRVNLNPKTLAGYESLLRARILPRWGDVPLSKVSHAKVVAWVAQMRAGGLSASRTRQAYHLLSAMLDDAVATAGWPVTRRPRWICHGFRRPSAAT
jgi:hypothetical protein